MSDTAKMGQLLTGEEGRDAVHIAICPVITGQEGLKPGDHVGLAVGTATESWPVVKLRGPNVRPIGIIDPYLQLEEIPTASRVYLFLYPGTISGLRHVWTHPDFQPEGAPPVVPEPNLLNNDANYVVISPEVRIEATRAVITRAVSMGTSVYDAGWRVMQMANRLGWSYEEVMDEAQSALVRGYFHTGDTEMYGEESDSFWDAIYVLTGRRSSGEPPHYSCAC